MKFPSKKSPMPLIRQMLALCGLIILLAIPTAVRAQYNYTTNNGAITITGYTGSGGAVAIPDYINSLPVIGIGTNAFFATATLTNVTLGTNILSLGNFAFENCSNLASVTIAAGATNISVSLFQNCVSLTNIALPNTVTKIGTNAFYNCISLASVTLPNSITNIANTAFAYCGSLSNVLLPTNLTSISTGVFQNCSNLTSVGISNKVTSIGNSAFAYCTNLPSIILPTNLTSIGSSAFQGCTSLTNITLPASLSSFAAPVFLSCSSLTAINVNTANNAYSSVAGVLFNKNQTMLVEYPGGLGGSYTIPNSVINIGTTAFENCPNLTGISISNSVSIIGLSAFQGCTSLTSITNLGSISNIANNLFFGCNSLTNVTIPNSVTNIGLAAFENCSNLTSLTIPGNVVSLGQSAFQNCIGLTNITIPNSVTNLGPSAFQNCTNLISVTNLGNISSIPINLFFGCSSLTNLTISGSVTSIGQSAFQNCTHLANIIIPSNVTNIGISAFNNCTNLKAIYFQTNAPTLGNTVFLNDSAKVYYLAGATGWGATFGGMVTVLDTVTVGVSSTNGPAPLTVTFSAANVDSATNPISSWNWDFGDGTTSTGQNPAHTYTAVGSYSPVLTATNSLGLMISVTNPPITATIVIPFTYVTNGNSITLTGYTGTNGVATIPATLNGWPLTGIGYQAFNGPGLTNVVIPNSVTNIATNAFYICTNLTNITVDAANPVYSSLNGVLFDKAQLSLIAFPSGRNGSYTVPNSVTNVGPLAFAGCGLTNVIIPGSVTNIDAYAFESCTHLNSAYFQGNAPPDLGNAFLNDSTTVYYLAGTTGWGATFGGMVTVLDTVTVGVSSTNGPAPLTVTFSAANVDSATNPISSWNWDFGDGTTSTGQNPAHTYTAVGSYSPVLTATNSLGLMISVTNPPITATIVIPFTYVTNGNSITLTGYTGTNGVATIPATLNGWPLTGIGYQAFNGPGLTNVVIPNSVTNIATNAFYICTNLTNITVDAANPVYSSLNGVLFDKAQLSLIAFPSGRNGSYTLPNSVTNVGPLAFAGCGLTNVIIPGSVTDIGAYAFESCTGLQSAYFQGNAPPDLGNAFLNDSTTVYYLAGATGWGATFGGAPVVETCPAITLSPPTLPDGTSGATYNQTTTGNGGTAPYGFAVSSGSLPPGLTLSSDGVLAGTPATNGAFNFTITAADANGCNSSSNYTLNVAPPFPFLFVTNGNAITITGYIGLGGKVIIPGTINGLPVMNIGYSAFYGTSPTNIFIPYGVTNIGNGAFASCTSLINVNIPASVTTIGYSAFYQCISLASISIPATVTTINDFDYFAFCNSLTSINVDPANPAYSSVNGVFFDKSQQTLLRFPCMMGGNYTIPGSVTNITMGTFQNCTKLNSVSMSDNVISLGPFAFLNCSSLTSIRLSAHIPSIGVSTFNNCSSLQSMNMPNSVISVDADAFNNCSGMTSLTLSTNLTSIGEFAFNECYNLQSVTLPNSLTSIGLAAFQSCWTMTSLTISSNLASIGDFAFGSCFRLTSLFIPNGVTSIGNDAFAGCWDLTNVIISASVTNIGSDAFNVCFRIKAYFLGNAPLNDGTAFSGWSFNGVVHYLAGTTGWGATYGGLPAQPQIAPGFNYAAANGSVSITGYSSTNSAVIIPDTLFGLPVTSVAARAFANVNYVTNVSITPNITSLGDGAFAGTGLNNVSIGSNVTNIGNEVFMNCTSLTNITVAAANPSYSSAGGVLFDKAQFNLIQFPTGLSGNYAIPNGVTNVGDYSFTYSGLTNVAIPATVTGIGASAFYGCAGLTTVFIPAGVTGIGDQAFANCTSLTNITVDAANPDYSSVNGALLDKGQTTLIQFPAGLASLPTFAGVTSVGVSALAGCVNLTTMVIPDGIQIIGDPVFYNCTNLTSISIPASVTTIGLNAFANCTKLTNIIVDAASLNFSSLNGVLFDKAQTVLIQFPAGLGGGYTVPNTVTSIGDAAFNGCPSLTSVSIGGNVASIGAAAFAYCTRLTNITVSVSNPKYSSSGGVLFDKLQKTLIGFPAGLTGSYKIPASVTNIADQAFAGGNLTSLTISANVLSIGDESFADCPDLDAVYFLGNAPASDSGTAFAGDNNFVHVYYLPGATGLNSGSFGGTPTVLWNPQKQAPGMAAGNFKFAITGPANGAIVIEACTNLINPVWQPVGTNVLDENGNSTFTDSQGKTHSGRYYRFRTP